MGKIRISIPSENLGFPYPVCKKVVYITLIIREDFFKVVALSGLFSV